MPPTVDRHISVRLNRGCLASVTVPFVFSSALVNLYTHDIEAGLHFYRDLLGFVETFAPHRRRPPSTLSFAST